MHSNLWRSSNGIYGWQQALGSTKVLINSLKHKHVDEQATAKNVKKAKKAEVDYLPSHPPGETDDTLEHLRLDLLASSQKRDCSRSINDLMARTFSWRRKEVVLQHFGIDGQLFLNHTR